MGDQKKTIRLLLIDDHEIVRVGLRTLLNTYASVEVVGEAGTVEAAISETVRLVPDVALVDVRLPDGNAFGICREIQRQKLPTRVIILTAFNDDQILLEALTLGVDGFLLKGIGSDDLVRAIQTVAAGQSILDPTVTKNVLWKVKSLAETPVKRKLDQLSAQEFRVLTLVAEGKTNKEIGTELGLSDKTVKNYLANLMEKLQINRRSKAAAFFAQQKIE